MKRNRHFTCMLYLFLWSCCMSCNNTTKINPLVKDSVKAGTIYTGHENYLAIYDAFTEFLMNASFTDSINISARIHFSNAATYDTFLITIPPGPIASSMSELIIKTAPGGVVYSESFQTKYFAREIVSPDTQPADTGLAAYDKHMLRYILSITPEMIKKSVLAAANRFFNDNVAPRSTLTHLDKDGIVDKDVFDEAMAGSTVNFIWIPCFSCDEGVNLVGYSKKKQKAYIIYSMD